VTAAEDLADELYTEPPGFSMTVGTLVDLDVFDDPDSAIGRRVVTGLRSVTIQYDEDTTPTRASWTSGFAAEVVFWSQQPSGPNGEPNYLSVKSLLAGKRALIYIVDGQPFVDSTVRR
jgi:hypothetical protein